jgi:hypothetical protein
MVAIRPLDAAAGASGYALRGRRSIGQHAGGKVLRAAACSVTSAC